MRQKGTQELKISVRDLQQIQGPQVKIKVHQVSDALERAGVHARAVGNNRKFLGL